MYDDNFNKLAISEKNIGERIINAFWSQSAGPIENLLNIVEYALPFIPGIGWGMFFLSKFVDYLGLGISDLGAELDKELGLGPGSNLESSDASKIEEALKEVSVKKVAAQMNNDAMIKTANPLLSKVLRFMWGKGKGLFKKKPTTAPTDKALNLVQKDNKDVSAIVSFLKKIPGVSSLIIKLALWVLSVTGASEIKDLYKPEEALENLMKQKEASLGIEDMLGMSKVS